MPVFGNRSTWPGSTRKALGGAYESKWKHKSNWKRQWDWEKSLGPEEGRHFMEESDRIFDPRVPKAGTRLCCATARVGTTRRRAPGVAARSHRGELLAQANPA